jgi:hypothetical protein
MTGTGLNHHAWIMAPVPHSSEHGLISAIEIDQDIASILVVGIRVNINIATLAVANAQESYGGGME